MANGGDLKLVKDARPGSMCPGLTGFLFPKNPSGIVPGAPAVVNVAIVNQECIAETCAFWGMARVEVEGDKYQDIECCKILAALDKYVGSSRKAK